MTAFLLNDRQMKQEVFTKVINYCHVILPDLHNLCQKDLKENLQTDNLESSLQKSFNMYFLKQQHN